jgi:hypothetical protein
MNQFHFELSTGRGRYGLQPQIIVTAHVATSRALCAALHRLAAEAELATPGTDRWAVELERLSETQGCVRVELLHETKAEVERALHTLRAALVAFTERHEPRP